MRILIRHKVHNSSKYIEYSFCDFDIYYCISIFLNLININISFNLILLKFYVKQNGKWK